MIGRMQLRIYFSTHQIPLDCLSLTAKFSVSCFAETIPWRLTMLWNFCISKGSASQGLRALRQLGAVSSVFAPGDRKERFVAESRLRKLVGGFLKEQADPHLEKGTARLKQIESLVNNIDDVDARKRGARSHEILSGWHRQMSRLLPWVKMIVGKSDRLPKKSSD